MRHKPRRSAEVKGKKVVNMSAGSLPVQKAKSNRKMADGQIDGIRLAANGEIQIAQADVYMDTALLTGSTSTAIGIQQLMSW